MSNTAYDLTKRLLNALDNNYNVVDMCAISEIISVLENINITKELLETTRLGKHVNELRRKTSDAALARRAKLLVKRWRDLVIPDRTGVKVATHLASGDSTPRQSPLASRGISPAVTPAVTPRLCSPQVPMPAQGLSQSYKHGSLTPSSGGMKPTLQPQRRQPLTSPALQNLSPAHRMISPGLRTISPALKTISPGLKNISPGFKNMTSGFKNISPGLKNISPSVKNISPSVKNISPNVKNISPGIKGISPGSRNISPGPMGLPTIKNVNQAVKNLSPVMRLMPETIKNITPTNDADQYDSDSQDVIFVDDDVFVEPPKGNDRNFDMGLSGKASKRPRSPLNGDPGLFMDDKSDTGSRRDAKKARREPGGRKAKKRRNHTKSENRTVDHSLDPVPGSPFLPISSASTSPALSSSLLNNGMGLPIPSPALLIDDLDSRSPKPEPKARSSRKNGCKKSSVDMDDYSTFIKNKIPAAGKKVKTTKELLEDIQARKSGKIVSVENKSGLPKEDFLTAYDNLKKKESVMVTDVIELNDSNSGYKTSDMLPETLIKEEVKVKVEDKEVSDEPIKFEPLEVILARLPPIDKSWLEFEEETAPACTCSLIYSTPTVEVKMPSPPQAPKRSIFEMDYDEAPKVVEDTTVSSVVVPAPPLFEEKIDPNCMAARAYHSRPADVSDPQVLGLHNCYIPDVNGTECDISLQADTSNTLACEVDQWGQQPFYDCSRDLFLNVVPKFNYLDYSLDKCVKNLININLDKYEPAAANESSREWLDELESKNAELIRDRDLKTDDYHSPADSPFSEKAENEGGERPDSNLSVKFNINSFSEIKDNVNLDRDFTCSNSLAASPGDDTSRGASNNNDPTFNKLDDEGMVCDSVKSESCDSPCLGDSQLSFLNQSQFSQDRNEPNIVKNSSSEVRKPRRFTYGDSVLLLPLSLAALNATAGFVEDVSDNVCDLSCVFRTKALQTASPLGYDSVDTSNIVYNSVLEPVTLEMKDLTDSAVERLKRYGKVENVTVLDQSEDAVCGSDLPLPAVKSETGALKVCAGGGCPVWLGKLSRDDAYREWHEPVVRPSFNGEPLTILPYVVID